MAKTLFWGLVVCLGMAIGTNAWAGQWQQDEIDPNDVNVDVPSASYESSNTEYIYTVSDGEVTITEYIGSGGDVVIPGTIEGLPVVSIGDRAFYDCSGLTSVTIPDSVTSIGDVAFSQCYDLTSVTIGNSVTSIGDYAFSDCVGLTSVTIPDSVTSIGDYAFSGCSGLTSITIPDSVTSIGNRAFSGCSGLTSLTIPDGVTSIGYGAFDYCSALSEILVDANNLVYSSHEGILYNKDKTVLVVCPGGKSGGVTIPDSVTSIGDYAFYYCKTLTSVTIPDSVTSIGDSAFSHCYDLSVAVFFGNAPLMGEDVFDGSTSGFNICYTSGATGFTTPTWEGYPAAPCACTDDNDCTDGYSCVAEQCVDVPPTIDAGPFLAAGWWPVLPTSIESPRYLKQNGSVLWTFNDDYASCSEQCTHSATVSSIAGAATVVLDVETDASGEWFAYVELPIEGLQNETTHALRFSVTDCAGQTTQSGEYFFRTAVGVDTPPVIMNGPLVAAGAWDKLPKWWQSDQAPVLSENTNLLWTFTDDYLDCEGACTHRARYSRHDGSNANWVWTQIPVSTDPTGKAYAYAELPIDSLDDGTYVFWFDVADCAGQRVYSTVHSFKVDQPQ